MTVAAIIARNGCRGLVLQKTARMPINASTAPGSGVEVHEPGGGDEREHGSGWEVRERRSAIGDAHR